MTLPTEDARRTTLGSIEVRRMLTDFVRRKVPAADVDDVVQMVLLDALASTTAPEGDEALQKWLMGVARHKIADFHRKGSREKPAELPDLPTVPAPVEEHELVRWAEREAGKSSKDGARTLAWMAREGEGDKLEHIAAEEKLPAATVRQRVSRMRRFMRERWLAEVAAVALLGLLAFVVYRALREEPPIAEKDPPAPAPTAAPDTPRQRALALREAALEACDDREFLRCERALDDARALDPDGEAEPAIEDARRKIAASKAAPQRATSPLVTSLPPSLSATGTASSSAAPSSTSTPPDPKNILSPTVKPPSPAPTSPAPTGKPSPTTPFGKSGGKPAKGPVTSFGSESK